jgi:hypothetical protein
MKTLFISFAVIFGPLAACCGLFFRTIRAELRNLNK